MQISFTLPSRFLAWRWENVVFHKKVQDSGNEIVKYCVSSYKRILTFTKQINDNSKDTWKLYKENGEEK